VLLLISFNGSDDRNVFQPMREEESVTRWVHRERKRNGGKRGREKGESK
jgi:hypothetical protein